MKHIIWSNNDLNYDDWKNDLEECYPDENGYNDNDRLTLMYEINEIYLDTERMNLNKELGQPIVMLASLGLWDRNCSAYKFISGTNLNSCLSGSCGDYVTWYVEDNDVKCEDIHHDGTNYYTYRILKPEYTQEDFEEFAYDNTIFEAAEKMTEPLGHYVQEIYGW